MTSTVHDSIRTSDVFDEKNLPTPPVSCVTDTGGQKHVQFDLSRNVKSQCLQLLLEEMLLGLQLNCHT